MALLPVHLGFNLSRWNLSIHQKPDVIHVNTLKVTFPNQIVDSLIKFRKNKTWLGATLGLMELCNSSFYDYRFKAVVPSWYIYFQVVFGIFL